MTRIQFEELLVLIVPKIKKINFFREPIEPAQRLLLTLRLEIGEHIYAYFVLFH